MTHSQDLEPDRPAPIRIGVPILLLLLLLAALTGGLLMSAVRGQDAVAREASATITEAAFNAEREALEKLVRDYTFWNDSLENLIFELNPGWIPENLDWIVENFGVSRVFVYGPERDHIYAARNTEPLQADDAAWRNPALLALLESAATKPDTSDESASAYIEFAGGVHLVAASKLLQEADTTGHPPYPDKGILVVTKEIDHLLLNSIETSFRLPDLALQPGLQADPGTAALALPGPDGNAAALITWNPPRPGTRLLQDLVLPLVLAFVLVGGLMMVILVRARRAGQALHHAFEARVAAQQELEYAARHDPLTDLPNRALFLEHLTSAIAHAERYGSGFTLHYLDLDGFKQVNDTLGHPAGDELLRELADRLTGIVRAADIAARFGGDEFAVLQRGTGDEKGAALLAERMVRDVERPFKVAGQSVHVTLSVGIAFDTGGEDAEEIIRKADRALYRAKRSGGNRFEIYDAVLDGATERKPSSPAHRPRRAMCNG